MTSEEYQYFFHQGTLQDAYNYLGCQYDKATKKAIFRVWAPHAKSVSVIGDFNYWDKTANYMWKISQSGIFEGVIEGIEEFQTYKYFIKNWNGRTTEKADPYGFFHETRGRTASKIASVSDFYWDDKAWLDKRRETSPLAAPISIYECNMSSWRKYGDGNDYGYRKFADEIVFYLKFMNFTHLELMGIAEYPFDGSWGYQVTGYYAPTSRYGRPEDFAYLVNKCHENGIAVILDWVPGHFPKDAHGLYNFDGQPCFEPENPYRSEHKEWGTMCFDYGKPEVDSFLISNAMMWFDKYHIDGLRVDAVASMLYLDYNRSEWQPNIYGGKENLEAIEFFKKLNTAVFAKFPNVLMIAEESTAFPMVTKPVYLGGLGFNYKWNMGWMNDSLSYIKQDPVYRSYNHQKLTFSLDYAFSENYILPVSHDEVVYGKGSLIGKMPGDYALKFAGVRNYLAYMFGHPGKKLLFMGNELGQWGEWDWKGTVDWLLVEFPQHKALQSYVKELNRIYNVYSPLYDIDDSWDGFEWLVCDDAGANVLVFERRDRKGDKMLFVINFSPCNWEKYRIPCSGGEYEQILASNLEGWNSDGKTIKSETISARQKPNSFLLDIDMMSAYVFYQKANTTASTQATKEKQKIRTTK